MNEYISHHSEEQAHRTAYLIAGFIRKTLTEKEGNELDAWIVESDENLELFEKLTDEENIQIAMQDYLQLEREKAEVLVKVKKTIGLKSKNSLVRSVWPYLAAACIILVAGSLFLFRKNNTKSGFEKAVAQLPEKQNIKAGYDKAILTLSDGRSIILDSSSEGLLTEDHSAKLTKQKSGELSYEGSKVNELAFNTLSTPRGSQYKLVLSDGSKVWMNAESSLYYPVSFTGSERRVELKGEAYFEVQKNASKPFLVSILTAEGPISEVKVLGTRFNINAYSDDHTVATTLIEGSIQLESKGQTKILKPSEQAISSENIKIIKVDTGEVMAWKDGKFLFRDATMRSIGEQIKRWYDVAVTYQGNVSDHFNAEIDRNISLQKLLHILEGTGRVHFSLVGQKLTIKP
jgi:transmembrane sensor